MWKTAVDAKERKKGPKKERKFWPDGKVENQFKLDNLSSSCRGFPLSHRPGYDDETIKLFLTKDRTDHLKFKTGHLTYY
jgi:hypothetical protein